MTTIKLPTVEGHEIELDVADHARLCAWPDMDLSCIHVVGDDALHALKPSTGKLHALSLEEMLRVRFKPCNCCRRDLPETVFPTSRNGMGYRSTCTSCRNARRRAQRAADQPPVVIPLPGPPGDLLKRYARDLKPPLSTAFTVDGVPRPIPPVEIGEQYTRIPLRAPGGAFVGFVRLDTTAYGLLTSPMIKAERWLWTIHPRGLITVMAGRDRASRAIYGVERLLEEHGVRAKLAVEQVEYPEPSVIA